MVEARPSAPDVRERYISGPRRLGSYRVQKAGQQNAETCDGARSQGIFGFIKKSRKEATEVPLSVAPASTLSSQQEGNSDAMSLRTFAMVGRGASDPLLAEKTTPSTPELSSTPPPLPPKDRTYDTYRVRTVDSSSSSSYGSQTATVTPSSVRSVSMDSADAIVPGRPTNRNAEDRQSVKSLHTEISVAGESTESLPSTPDLTRNLSMMLKQLVTLGREIKESRKQERVLVAQPGLPKVIVTPPTDPIPDGEDELASPVDFERSSLNADTDGAHQGMSNTPSNNDPTFDGAPSSNVLPLETQELSRSNSPAIDGRHSCTLAIPDVNSLRPSAVDLVLESHEPSATVQSAPSVTSMEAIDWDSLPLQPTSRFPRLRSLACF
ncbi:hypothetical protein PUNSTDRAFT_133372 [Punctularia strigosozonata HHB-11173 SS5]|uniref:uncharacterized protein n=1 Tax=Punctularia strigosozonata (strain HHB-11173) TaxID=741275 RepID=UPI0004417295|nr:uncharacterized protein PUNSTDRAFT_133372 [Punctularia strigosozonata HHB-11173 SS5]EIN09588.1 hypothetical protein PUNSTDRAFT_133372 [Punctularia strigosozonata HHB-11173 SS5]